MEDPPPRPPLLPGAFPTVPFSMGVIGPPGPAVPFPDAGLLLLHVDGVPRVGSSNPAPPWPEVGGGRWGDVGSGGGHRGWGFGVTRDGMGSPGMVGRPRMEILGSPGMASPSLGSPGMGIWGHQGWGHRVWGHRGWGFGVTRDGMGSPGMMGTPRMGIWGQQGWYGVTRYDGDTEDGDLGSPGMGSPCLGVPRTEILGSPWMVWGHQG